MNKKIGWLQGRLNLWNAISYRVKVAGEKAFNDMPLGIIVYNGKTSALEGNIVSCNHNLVLFNKIKGNKLLLINKIDLIQKIDLNKLNNDNYLKISVKDNLGIEELKNEIINLFKLGELETEDLTYLTDARSISLLNKSLEYINESINSINNNEPIDIIEFNIKDAWETLGEIIGETYKDELLDELFSRFCLGK